MDHSPLLSPGVHDIAESELTNHFLSEFPSSRTRQTLITGLKKFIKSLRSYGVDFELWIDGSFTTVKIDPNDIDIVIFFSEHDLNNMSDPAKIDLKGLVDRHMARQNFGCDVLVAIKEDQNQRSYWRGWYGFDRNENPKGIARIVVGV